MKIGIGRYGDSLRRLLQVAEEPGFELDETLQGVFVLESNEPEWLFLRGERRGSVWQDDAADVAAISHIGVRNPTGSGVLCIIEEVDFLNLGGATITPEYGFSTLAEWGTADAEGAGWSHDSRGWTPGTGLVRMAAIPGIKTGLDSLGTSLGIVEVSITTSVLRTMNVILAPGFVFVISPQANNIRMTARITWRERPLSRFER